MNSLRQVADEAGRIATRRALQQHAAAAPTQSPLQIEQRYTFVWKQLGDDRWEIFRDMTNSVS